MKESKLQYLGRTLAERVLIATGEERRTLCSVLADVMWVMGQDVELPENDPVHWFDPLGRFCTRAQSRAIHLALFMKMTPSLSSK